MADHEHPQPQTQTPGHRDMMFCHECQDEWYRDEHGLTCPECGSDFTEIIEDDNDPRDHHIPDDADDDMDSIPDLEEAPALPRHPLHDHNPWQTPDDPEEGDISNLQWRQVGPGRFAVTGTIQHTLSPADFQRTGAGVGGGPMAGFTSMLQSILGGTRMQQPAQDQHQDQDNQNAEARNSPSSVSGTTPSGHRFTYTAGARLFPRDADHPGPRMEPVDELNTVLLSLMSAMEQTPGHQHHRHHHARGEFEPEDSAPGGRPLNPLMALFSQMMTGNGQFGDAVYTQEALDRIVSQLMEQNPSSNAPGPASQNDIDSLPRRTVTEEMLGAEGRAECSICMEEVKLGEEVTELPCTHWFHHPCVAAWLGEHDTCPHCRKGITKQPPPGSDQPNVSGAGASSAPGLGAASQMPGAFDSSADAPRAQGQNQNPGQAGGAPDGGAGGFADMVRRGLFGPQR